MTGNGDNGIGRLVDATILVPFPGAGPPRWVLDGVERGLAGVTLFALNGNVDGPEQLAGLTAALRAAGDPLVSIDEEGGDVTRLAHETGSRYPGNAALGAVDDIHLTASVYRAIGGELAAAGVNLDLAPVVDVNTADDNPIIGTRAFGAKPELVSRHAAAAVAGLQDAGVAACVKHFPGHGATSQDSHLEVPTVAADQDLLDRRELAPFRAAVAAGTRTVMTGHLRIPAVTGDEPATLSHPAVTGLLRERLGFRGVVVTDALDMRAASGPIGIPEAAVRSLLAGADLLCLGAKEYEDSVRAIRAAIVDAVRAGRLPAERLEQAVDRVRGLKAWLADQPDGRTDGRPAASGGLVGLRAARRAVRLFGPSGAPGVRPELRAPLVVELQVPPNIAVGPVPWGFGPWTGGAGAGRVELVRVSPDEASAATVLDRAAGRSLVVVVRDAHRYPACQALVSALVGDRPDAVVVEMGLPVWRPPGVSYLATYGAARVNALAAAELLGLTTTRN